MDGHDVVAAQVTLTSPQRKRILKHSVKEGDAEPPQRTAKTVRLEEAAVETTQQQQQQASSSSSWLQQQQHALGGAPQPAGQ